MAKGKTLLFVTGFIGIAGLAFGAWSKITHRPYASETLTITLVAFAIFYLLTLWDLLNRHYPDRIQKILWLLLVIMAPVIGPLLYHAFKKNNN